MILCANGFTNLVLNHFVPKNVDFMRLWIYYLETIYVKSQRLFSLYPLTCLIKGEGESITERDAGDTS